MLTFSIAGLVFEMRVPHPITVTENFVPFRSDDQQPDFRLCYDETPSLPQVPGEMVFRNILFEVWRSGDRYTRVHIDHLRGDRPYAVTTADLKTGEVLTRFLGRDRRFFSESHNCFSHIGFEELLISRDRLILHASFVETPYGGLLFSGPSGVGKSTQAALWEEFGGGTQINGDRPVLSRTSAGWMAHGSPYAGSSRCYANRSCPIAAVVMLEQAEACALRRLAAGEAFRALFSGMTVNSWNEAYVERVCDLTMDLAERVPVYRLACTPDRRAVELLNKELEVRTP